MSLPEELLQAEAVDLANVQKKCTGESVSWGNRCAGYVTVEGRDVPVDEENPLAYAVDASALNPIGVCMRMVGCQCHRVGSTSDEIEKNTGVAGAQVAGCIIPRWEDAMEHVGYPGA